MLDKIIDRILGVSDFKLTKNDSTLTATFINRRKVVLVGAPNIDDEIESLLDGWSDMGWRVFVEV